MKRFFVVAAMTLPFCAAQQPDRKPDFFPLTNHSRWEYSGTAKLKGNPGSQPVQFRMEVIDVQERAGVRAAWVRGNPLSLTDYSVGPGDQVIARVGQRMYLADTARSTEVRARMENPADSLAGLFKETEFLVDTTMPVGNGATMVGTDYQITRNSKEGFRTIRFTPGIGISEFRFADSDKGESGNLKLDASDVQPEIPTT
jgi:hypothetical protein